MRYHIYGISNAIDSNRINEELQSIITELSVPVKYLFTKGYTVLYVDEEVDRQTIDREKILLFSDVVCRLYQKYPLLPFQYGTVFKSIQEIEEIIELHSNVFDTTIRKIRDKDEYEIKILSVDEKECEYVVDVSKQESRIFETNTGKEITASRQYIIDKYSQYKKELAYQVYVDNLKEKVIAKTRDVICEYVFKKSISKRIVVDLIFLLEKEKKQQLTDIVQSLEVDYPSNIVVLTGPWPPYNFIQINI